MRKIITIIAVIMMAFAGFAENWKAEYRVGSFTGDEVFTFTMQNPHWTKLKNGFWVYPNSNTSEGGYIDPYFNNEVVDPIFRKAIEEAKALKKNIGDMRFVFIEINKDKTNRTFIYDVDQYILWEYKR